MKFKWLFWVTSKSPPSPSDPSDIVRCLFPPFECLFSCFVLTFFTLFIVLLHIFHILVYILYTFWFFFFSKMLKHDIQSNEKNNLYTLVLSLNIIFRNIPRTEYNYFFQKNKERLNIFVKMINNCFSTSYYTLWIGTNHCYNTI